MLQHDPVLINEVEALFIALKRKKYVVDATLGLGGHAKMLISHIDTQGHFVGIDRDKDNLSLAKTNIGEQKKDGPKVSLVHRSFADLSSLLSEYNIPEIDFILYDLGVSSAHYDDGERGFSLRYNAPLDMRFDRTIGKTARDLIEKLDSRALMQIFSTYADEKKAYFIAEAIVAARKIHPIETTEDLLKIIEESSFDKKSPIRVFQALRIAVNEEFKHIEDSLRIAIDKLALGGRIAVITFHSIEDRLVKHLLAPYAEPTVDPITGRNTREPRLKKVTKKPIEPTEEEIHTNPRSRSAKLRIMERIN